MGVDVEEEMKSAVEKRGHWLKLVRPETTADAMEADVGEWLVQVIDVRIVDMLPPVVASDMCMNGRGFINDMLDHQESCEQESFGRTRRSCHVLLFGALQTGASFLAKVDNFRPHLYVDLPSRIDDFLSKVSKYLNLSKESIKSQVVRRRNTYGWIPEPGLNPLKRKMHHYLQLFFPTMASYRKISMLVSRKDEKAENASGATTQREVRGWEGAFGNNSEAEQFLRSFKWHEAQVCAETKFCDDNDIVPSDWVSVRASRCLEKVSHCKVEVDCKMSSITPVPRSELAPLLIAFFDIECVSATMSFPDAEQDKDEVHQIGINFWRIGCGKETVVQVVLVQPPECGAVHDAYVIRCQDEASLLSQFRSVIMDADPDIITHYNGFGFDLPYLCSRAKKLRVEDFLYMDRVVQRKCRAAEKSLSSKGLGDNGIFLIDMFGRTNLDMFQWIKANVKLSSYKLDSVGEYFLGEKKLEMNYKELFRMAVGSAAEIAYVATYCLRDCYMLVLLAIRLQIFTSNIEMSRVCHTPMEMLVTRGQQIKVINLLNWFSHRQDTIDDQTREGGHILNTPESYSGGEGDSYTGAFVLDPLKGFHKRPVAVLDFMSLYPTIILANNFCFSTLVQDPQHMGVAGVDYAVLSFEGKTYTWAKSHLGVIPVMMRSLLAARKEAKKKMNAAGEARNAAEKALASAGCSPERRAELIEEMKASGILASVFDARQKALKVSANSIYGFTGALTNGKYHCLAVADCVTYMSRTYLQKTIDLAITYTSEHCSGGACDIVYGDTDSIMIKPKDVTTVEECAALAGVLAAWITEKFREMTGTDDIVLEFEKTFCPWLLLGKKRYAGMMYEAGSSVKKLDAKGIELVRRDNCAFAKRMQKGVLDALMEERDPALACERIKEQMARVVDDSLPIKDYIISKSLRKEYKTEDLPHVHVCKKMARRNPGSEPRCGDRVPYVLTIVKNRVNAKTFEKAEDPVYVAENLSTCKIDRLYYVEHQVERSIGALMLHVVQNISQVFMPFKTSLMLQQTNQRTISSFLSAPRPDVAPKSRDGGTDTGGIEATNVTTPEGVEVEVEVEANRKRQGGIDHSGGDGGGAEKKGVQTLEDAMFGTHRRPVVQKKARKRK